MKTLNKTLSLVLVLVMVLGLFGVASATDFKDDAQIENQKAVQTAVALNIINGKDGNTFDPTGIVKRGEMCKMICVALNGGTEPTLGTLATPSFTDIAGHWAEKYVEYCYGLGIVAGNGDGTFAPDATVTGVQAAKMLLIALGYISDYEGFTGESWSVKVNTRAMEKGIYEDLAIDPNAGLNRDNAAQMVYNTLYAEMVKYDYGIAPGAGTVTGVAQAEDTGKTMLSARYKLNPNTIGVMSKIEYDEKEKAYTYTVDGNTFKTATDYSALFGMKVQVFWKDKVSSGAPFNYAEDTVYDILPYDSSKLATANNGLLGEFDADRETLQVGTGSVKLESNIASVTIGGTFTTYGSQVNLYVDYGTTVVNDTNAFIIKATDELSVVLNGASGIVGSTYNVTFIDNDNNGKVDTVVAIPFTIAKVTYAGATTTSFNNGVGSMKNEDITLYDGIAKNDIVAFYDKNCVPEGKDAVEYQAVKTATVSGVKGAGLGAKFQALGMWFSRVDAYATFAGGMSPANFALAKNPSNNDTIEFVNVGLLTPYLEVTQAGTTSKDICVVYQAAVHTPTSGVGTAEVQAKIMLADGTKKTVTVDKVDGSAVGASATSTVALIGKLATYIVNSDGNYELTTVATSGTTGNLAGYDGASATGAYVHANEAVAGYELADDAAVIVVQGTAGNHAGTNAARLYTGREIKNLGTNYGTSGQVLYSKVSGFDYARIAVIAHSSFPTATTGSNYAYLTADTYKTVEDGKTYRNYTMLTADGAKTYKEESSAPVTTLTAGIVITYDVTADGLVKNVNIPAIATDAVTGYNESTGKIGFDVAGNSKITSDTKIVYVHSKNSTAGEGAIVEALLDASENYVPNVRHILTGDGKEVIFLVVDVDQEMKSLAAVTVAPAAAGTAAELDVLFSTYDTVTVSGNWTAPAAAYTVPEGKTLVVTGTTTLTANTFTVNGTFKTGVIADTNIAQLAIGAKGTLIIAGAAASAAVVGQLEAITTDGAKVTFASATTSVAANKWCTTKGTAATAGNSDGAEATKVGATSAIPAGTYTYGTLGFSANNVTAADLPGWFKA